MELNSKQTEWLKNNNLEIVEGRSYLMIRPIGARWPLKNYWSVVELNDFRTGITTYEVQWNYTSNVCGDIAPAAKHHELFSSLKGALAELVTLCRKA
jgi:hypothetical protein